MRIIILGDKWFWVRDMGNLCIGRSYWDVIREGMFLREIEKNLRMYLFIFVILRVC